MAAACDADFASVGSMVAEYRRGRSNVDRRSPSRRADVVVASASAAAHALGVLVPASPVPSSAVRSRGV